MSQVDHLAKIMFDGLPHRSDELVSKVYSIDEGVTLARLGARIYDLKKKYGVTIKSWRDADKPKLWWYEIKSFARPVASRQPEPVVSSSFKTEGAGSHCECGGLLIEKESFGMKFRECFSCKGKKAA